MNKENGDEIGDGLFYATLCYPFQVRSPSTQVSHHGIQRDLGFLESSLDFTELYWCWLLEDNTFTELSFLFPPCGYYQAIVKPEFLKIAVTAETSFAVFNISPASLNT